LGVRNKVIPAPIRAPAAKAAMAFLFSYLGVMVSSYY
jgi:hypothetical protein